MREDDRKEIIRILEGTRGDDLYRARHAFLGMTEAQLDEQYGQSGQTCREIIAGYEKHNVKINDLIVAMLKA